MIHHDCHVYSFIRYTLVKPIEYKDSGTLGLSKQYSQPNTTRQAINTTKYLRDDCLKLTTLLVYSSLIVYAEYTKVGLTIVYLLKYEIISINRYRSIKRK